ncbi:hypothetical protein [Methylorubrum podarium]|jgi:hypothetical protein|uniref:hypothetical protein n=1 Tax=Methylorubrum podarium TaxID=200476 RepID=UPI001EE246C6|nr:hypothetical protein [Methylorubrum podarium]GJE69874.1 hypothetical protein CHKEEEPN_1405 [Methylorubrum podarium]
MRAAPFALLALVTPALAGPAERAAPAGAAPPTEASILLQRRAEESMARQAEFDRRIAERSSRAARSICSGCRPDGGLGPPGVAVTPGLRNPGRDELRPADPSLAPLD